MKRIGKIAYPDVVKTIFCLIIVCNIGILRVINIHIFTSGYSLRYITVILGMLLLIVSKCKISYWKIGVLFFELLMIVELIISTLIYNQNIGNILRQNIHVFYYILIIPLLSVNERNFKKIIKFLIIITIVTMLFKTASWYFYNFRGEELFPYLANEFGENWIRNDLKRYSSPAFEPLVFMLCSYLVLIKKKEQNRKNVLFEIFILIYMLFFDIVIYQARSETMICVFGFLITFLLDEKDGIKKKSFKYFIVIITVLGVIISGALDAFFSSFNISSGSSGGGTIRLRLEGFVYYGNLLKKNILCGIGFLDTTNPSTLFVFRGAMGNRYLDDLGILAFCFQFGLFGLFILICIVYRMLEIYKKEKSKDQKTLIGACFVTFILMCILGACPFDSHRMITIPFFIAIFEHLHKGEKIL